MIERSIAFGEGAGLIGTLCLPAPGAVSPAAGLLLFNAGMVHRVGPHRLNVRLARVLAQRGIPSLRFDLAGQGDSARSEGRRSFEEQAVADLRAAMDALGQAAGVARFAVFGFCSGGVHGYAVAQADPRVAGLLMYDTFLYPTARTRWNRYLVRIRQRGFVRAVGGWIGRHARRLASGGGQAAANTAGVGQFPVPSRVDFAAAVKALHARGTAIAVMVSGSFAALYNYEGQFRDAFRGFGIDRMVQVQYFPEVGHNHTPLADQAAFIERIAEWTAGVDRKAREGGRA